MENREVCAKQTQPPLPYRAKEETGQTLSTDAGALGRRFLPPEP